jgi:hypothetical protein
MAAAGPAGAGAGAWARKDEFLRLTEQSQKMVLLSDVEVGKEYFIMFGYNANPLFWFKYSIATCVRDIGGPNQEKEFVGDIVERDGNIVNLGVTFNINSGHENIFMWPPPNDGSGGSREILRPEWNGGSGGTASRKKSRKLKRKNRKSRKNRR